MSIETKILAITLLFLMVNLSVHASSPQGIYSHDTASNILRVDIEGEPLNRVIAYINSHFDANISLSPTVRTIPVRARVESVWINVLTDICAQNNLELVKLDNSLHVRLRQEPEPKLYLVKPQNDKTFQQD